MILQVGWPNQQCHSTEGRWLVNHVKGQSHQAQFTQMQSKERNKMFFNTYIAKLDEDKNERVRYDTIVCI